MKQRLVPALSWEVIGGDAVRIKLQHLLWIMINPDKSETRQGTHPVPHILSFTWTINQLINQSIPLHPHRPTG